MKRSCQSGPAGGRGWLLKLRGQRSLAPSKNGQKDIFLLATEAFSVLAISISMSRPGFQKQRARVMPQTCRLSEEVSGLITNNERNTFAEKVTASCGRRLHRGKRKSRTGFGRNNRVFRGFLLRAL